MSPVLQDGRRERAMGIVITILAIIGIIAVVLWLMRRA